MTATPNFVLPGGTTMDSRPRHPVLRFIVDLLIVLVSGFILFAATIRYLVMWMDSSLGKGSSTVYFILFLAALAGYFVVPAAVVSFVRRKLNPGYRTRINWGAIGAIIIGIVLVILLIFAAAASFHD